MDVADSALDRVAMAHARALLEPAARPERLWPTLAAAAFAAAAAMALATAMVLAPAVVTTHLPSEQLGR